MLTLFIGVFIYTHLFKLDHERKFLAQGNNASL